MSGSADLLLPMMAPQSVGTADGQAELALTPGSFPGQPGAAGVTVTLVPLDPNAVAKPPQGLAYRSNAYRVKASYLPSGAPVTRLMSTQLALEYVGGGDRILRLSGSSWDPLPTSLVAADQVASTTVATAGTFVVAGQAPSATKDSRRWLVIAAAGAAVLALLAVVLGVLVRRRAVV